MKSLLLAALTLISVNALAEEFDPFANGQIATLVNFEATIARPDSTGENQNVTSIFNGGMELTMPTNLSVYGGFTIVTGETFESALHAGLRYYSAAPALQPIVGAPVWSYIGGGLSFLDSSVYYPEAGFRIAIANSARVDIFMKILNSSNDRYDKHIMAGAGLTF